MRTSSSSLGKVEVGGSFFAGGGVVVLFLTYCQDCGPLMTRFVMFSKRESKFSITKSHGKLLPVGSTKN